ncbi:Inositol polyphosphate kinase [Penicillium coprophilum]|uniref:Inositol polyphosphate kinase n=1 Tax=Penicillium coprophilum TaxID=36646 RepID=UPI002398E6CF|nr:Inositol polyphosphate kinase [Penicillium coprophilum]KAJ5177955.1 Inositol polyphosphate kinase [Penicillium coprophilum]
MSSKSESRKTPQLGSEDLVPFDHAAAGHDGVRCTPSGALIAKPCTRQEVEFYESSALHPAFQEFMPLYVGSLSSSEQQPPQAIATARESGVLPLPESDDVTPDSSLPSQPPSHTASTPEDGAAPAKEEAAWVPSGGKQIDTGLSIVLENIACGFRRPNVLDVKLGARLWADDAPLEKRKKLDEVSKETTSSSLGYRIAGMKVWTGHNGETDEGDRTDPYATKYEGAEGEKGEVIEKDGYRRFDKWYGRSFKEDNVKQGFETFLAGAKAGKIDRSKMVAQRLAEELKNLQRVLESEESRMYSASVLVVYEGDVEAMEHAIEEEQKAPASRSREEDEDEDDEEFEIPEEALEMVNVQLADGVPQQAININIDPETMQMPEEDDDDEEETPKVHALRLIDFAHASWTPGQGPDENLLRGVRSLVKVFEELAE